MRSGWIGAERRRFASVSVPVSPTGVGLVIVPPFGYEAICSARALRVMAERAATAGLVAVRVDLDGTGDSEGDDLDRGRLEAWLASINDACDLARAEGADRIVLCGVRLGAVLATLAAGRRADVAGLVAIALVPSGKALLREMKMMQMALGLDAPPAGTVVEGDELVGFAISGETRVGLTQLDLVKATAVGAPAVLVVDRDDMPGNDKWAARLAELGAEVSTVRLPGYVEMVLDPHRAQVPEAIVAAVVAFAAARPALATPVAAAPIALRTTVAIAGVTEEVVAIDGLVAIATRPAAPPQRAVILLNAGAIRRIGPNRLHVALARRLAAAGDLVVRVDLSGLGESPPRHGGADNVVYSDHAIADVGRAVAWVRAQGAKRVAVVGLCAGAYHAQKAAVAGQPIDVIVPINPLTFFWTPGMPLDAQSFRVTSEAKRYGESMWSKASWQKLARGEVDVKRVAGILARRVRDLAGHRGRDVLRKLRVPLPKDLGSELRALDRRGVAMEFIFSAGDPGRAMLVEQGGSIVDDVAKRTLAVETILGPDHTFTPRWSHPILLDAIARAVHRR